MARGQPGSGSEQTAAGRAATATVRPRKSLGQHFLTDRRVLQRILAAASLSSADTVIEVGAGKGVLTQALASAATSLRMTNLFMYRPALRLNPVGSKDAATLDRS